MIVECFGCSKRYNHEFGKQMVCPACGEAGYSRVQDTKTEQKKPLNEQREPRILTEDMPLGGHSQR
jgi:rRNA maturation endonuclease Nob1